MHVRKDEILINTSLELVWYLGPSEWQLILSTLDSVNLSTRY